MQNNASRVSLSVVGTVMCALILGATTSFVSAQPGPVKVRAGRYIITRKSVSSAASAGSPTVNYSTRRSTGYFDVVVPNSHGSARMSATAQVEDLNWLKVKEHCKEIEQDETVASCEPDVLVATAAQPNDPEFGKQWGLHDPVNDVDIDVLPAWDRGTGSKSVIVGVIDSGVYYNHPDLLPNLWSNPVEPLDGVDNDGNGYVDDIVGVNADKGTNDPIDCSGHGTHVSGIIGAKGNDNQGVTGVNWTTSIVNVSASLECGPWLSTAGLLGGFDYFYDLKVRGHNIRVINASFGSKVFSQAMYDAIARLNSVGVLVVAAAGNENVNLSATPAYPASYDLPNIISVAATDRALAITSYSNFGQDVDIAAPGGENGDPSLGIYSTYSPLAAEKSTYESKAGTSMAAPMVTGALALVASQAPQFSGAQLKEILLKSAFTVKSLEGYVAGALFLNVGGMSELATGQSDQCPNDPNKTSPGVCGCGVADVDSDGDGTFDCQDGCASDKAKVTPGACGCGVADTDSDGDGKLNCQDACPSDKTKTSPGVCGCGIADSDANGNGRIDCQDIGIASVAPPAPTLRRQGRYLRISMTPLDGVQYYVQLTVTPPRGSGKRRVTGYYEVQSASVLVKGLKRGTRAQVRYAYFLTGTGREYSYWSPFKSTVYR